MTVALPVEPIREKELRVIGAHVSTLAEDQAASRAFGREAIAFLAPVARPARGRRSLSEVIDPRAGVFYRRLAGPRDLVAARFDWTCIPPTTGWQGPDPPECPTCPGEARIRPRPLTPGGGRAVRLLRRASTFEGARGGLRIGLLGCGDIGLLNAAAISAAPNARLVACFDPAAALADDIARVHGGDVARSSRRPLARGTSTPHCSRFRIISTRARREAAARAST